MSLGIGFGPCQCTAETIDPNCRNKFEYVRDWRGTKPVTLRECPNRLEDQDLWEDIKIALWEVKDWDRVLGYYGVPVVHLAPFVYNRLQMSFEAKERYESQKAQKER